MPDAAKRYEQETAHQAGMEHVIAFGFARHALVTALTATGLAAGDEVILSPLTCKVVPLALLSLGLKPVYSDISATTLNLDPLKLEALISPRTRAVLFQHTYGHTDGIQSTFELTRQHNLMLFEDCAQCLPLNNDNYSPGHFGECAIFSYNPGKPLPAGSGGVAVTRNTELASRIRRLRDKLPQRGHIAETELYLNELLQQYLLRPSLYWILFDLKRRVGNNYMVRSLEEEISGEISKTAFRPSNRQMHLGLKWLQRIKSIASHRTECCTAYRTALENNPAIRSPFIPENEPLYYYPVVVDNKTALLERARKQHVEIIPWPIKTPIYPVTEDSLLPMYHYKQDCCPIAESIANRLLGLPTHEKVTPRVINRVVELLNQDHGKLV